MALPDLWHFREALLRGNIQEVEADLINHFDSRVDEIERNIIRKFPRRENIIRSAFKVHRLGEFYSSIPVLLAQADGICHDVTQGSMFRSKNDKRPATANYVDRIASNAINAALLSPLAQVLPINASSSKRNDSTALNRHTVLHGEALDYGNKTNGLKAISLLNYVASVLGGEVDAPNSD